MKPTREQIENGTNEELDKWVAEFVMGEEFAGTSVCYRDDKPLYVKPGKKPNHLTDVLQSYSTFMSHTWKVHKKICGGPNEQTSKYLHAIGMVVSARAHGDRWWHMGWPLTFTYIEPEDICRAALLAVLEEEE